MGVRLLRLTPDGIARGDDWWREQGAVRAFGGQIVAHCLVAAAKEAPSGWACHSCHIHFLRAGRRLDTRYTVAEVRVGRSYATYRVSAVETGITPREIALATVSFHDEAREVAEGAPKLHAAPMPAATIAAAKAVPEANAYTDGVRWPVPADETGLRYFVAWDAQLMGSLQTAMEHVAAVGFYSDMRFLWGAHAEHRAAADVTMLASLDHAIFFHTATVDMTAPLLYEIDSPFAGSGRALVRGRLWELSTGTLIASTVQEGVLRVRARRPDLGATPAVSAVGEAHPPRARL